MGAELARDVLDAGLIAKDGERMIAFYRDVLQFPQFETLKFPGIGAVHRFSCGQSILRVVEPDVPPERDATGGDFLEVAGYRYITLTVSNLREVVEECRAAGCRIMVEPLESRPGMLSAQLQDPDGNCIEFAQQQATT